MITENLSTLKIHKLTKEQYERELEAGRIDASAMYLTPDEELDLSIYATVEQLNAKVADSTTNGNILIDGTETQVYSHPASGVSSGRYNCVTVNSEGHVTAGSNPTTLAGYGITDAATKSHDHNNATTSTAGFMSASDKTALDEVVALVGDESVAAQIGDAVDALEVKIAAKSDSAHTHDDRYYTESEVDTKLSGKSNTDHTHSAYVNQNAFSKVTVGSTTIEADSTTDTLTLVAGSNITLTPDASGDKVTIAAADTVYAHPTSGVTAGTYKSVTVNDQGHVIAGTNPTTLSGYGITDAATKTELKTVSDLVGDTEVSTQISDAIKNKSDVGHNHDEDYDQKGSADTALASAKTYADGIKNDLLNGAGGAYDTLKELGDLIDDNQDAIAALETVAAGKADAEHTHAIADITNLQTQLNAKVPTSRTVNGKALSANITISASDVGADASGSANTALTNAKAYTDAEITEWVGDTKVSEQITAAIASKSDSVHTHDDRYYTESEIDTKLSGKADTGHTHSSYANQNAFSNVKVGSTTIAADTTTDTLTLVAGSNITITPDATNDKVTIAATDTVYTHPNSGVTAGTYKSVTVNAQGHVTGGSNPTTLSAYGITDAATKTELNTLSGLVGDIAVSEQIDEAFDEAITGLSVSGKTITYTKGDGSTGTITTQDTNTVYTHPTYTAKNSGLYKVTVDGTGHVSGTAAVSKSDITALGIPAQDTTYSAATTSAAGLMSASDKSKLDGIATGANKTTVDSSLSTTSTNPVQNKVVNAAISNLNTLVGDTKVSTQISTAIASKSDTGHTHDDLYYTESEIDTKLSGKANSSHGNHVPATQTASNQVFLRNDNTWATVTPANIGAAAASHGTHVSYSTTAPVMDGTASVGSASTVARSDHKHPTDTSRAAASDLTALQGLVGDTKVSTQISNAIANKADASHTHSYLPLSGGTVTGDITLANSIILTSQSYGAELPTAGTAGRVFFKKVSG